MQCRRAEATPADAADPARSLPTSLRILTLAPFGFATRSSLVLAVLLALLGPTPSLVAAGGADPAREVVFVVDSVRDWPTLVDALPGDPEVIVIDGRRDGLAQMATTLAGRHGVGAIHVLSHGDVGQVRLGTALLDSDTVLARRADLATIGHALRPGGDLLLYGCAVAADGAGQPFIDALARATAADVAASSDSTGAASRGGNWTLEVTHGVVEASSLAPVGYDGLLVAFTDPLDTNIGIVASFQRTLGGVGFTYAFTGDGGGGDFAYEPSNGSGNSSSVNLMSADVNISTTERVTITRSDAADFTFTSLFVNNSGGATVTVAGYRDGALIGSAQTVSTGASATLTFASLHVDEVRLTSREFFQTNIDNFTGDTDPPLLPPSLTATSTNPTFTEGGSAVDLFSSVTADTNDVGQSFTGMVLTVTNVSNAASEELTIGGTSVALANGNSGSLTGIGSYSVSVVTSTATVTVTGMTRTNAQMGTLVDGISYTNSSHDPGSSNRVVTITGISDSGGSSNTAAPNRVSTVGMVPVNDAPTLSATGGTPTFTEDGSAVDLFSGVSINTIESGQAIDQLVLTVTNVADGGSERLGIDGSVVALTNGNAATTATNAMNVSVSVVSGTATVTVGKVGGISSPAAQTLVDGSSYSNTSHNPTTGARVVTVVSVRDTGGTTNGGVNTTILAIAASVTVADANDAPAITAPGSISVTEDVATALTGISFADADAGSAALTATLSVPSGALAATSGGGVTVGGTSTALTLLGSVTNLNTFIAGSNIVFTTASHATSHVVLTVAIDDGGNTGAGGAQSDSTTVTLSVTAVNDAPGISAPASISVTEEIATALTGISFADVDAGSASVTATFSASSGSLAATSGAGVTVGGTASALTLTGSVANINAYIAGANLTFATALDATANVTLGVGINDGGNTGAGGAETASTTVTLVVTAVNDAPVITAPPTIAVTEDVAAALTGLSFSDPDAGSGAVTVTLSVPAGTLAASSGGGVTVGGTASALTLTGTVANVNAFVAAGNVTFTTASNASTDVTLSVSVDDGGNTGSGGAQTASTTVTLDVAAVNDAPVNVVPTAQSVDQDSVLVFNMGNGNLIAISDVDAGSNEVEVTLAATNGVVTLAGTTGLSFSVGSGTGDATKLFRGSIADINAALAGLSFAPTAGYNGAASIELTTNDQGWSGSGGARGDVDTIDVTVDPVNAKVTSVSSSRPNGIVKLGDVVPVTVVFDQAVDVDTVGGLPTLQLETGTVDRLAIYTGGSGSSTLTFTYTVQAGDSTADLEYTSASALALNGAFIESFGNAALLTLPSPGACDSLAAHKDIVVDGVVPAVASVTPPANGTYAAGQVLTFAVGFSEPVTVTGTPLLPLSIDAGVPLTAAYLSGSGTTTLLFLATVQPGQDDSTGIVPGPLVLDGGTIADAAGNAATLTLNGVGSTTGVLIDTLGPALTLGAPSVTSTISGPVTFDVTYVGAAAVTLSAADITLVSTGTASATMHVSGIGSTRTVTLSEITGTGSLAISIAAGTAADASGNHALAAGPSGAVTVTARSLTGIYPTSGLDSGGVEVTLRGVGFSTLTAAAVHFGSVPALLVTVVDDATIRAIAPALPAGTAVLEAGLMVMTGGVDVTLADGATTVGTLTGGYLPLARPSDATADTDGDALPDLWELRHGLDAASANDASLDPDNDGRANVAELAAGTHPRGTSTQYFAEGVSSDTMSTAFAAFNPGATRGSIVVHYLRDGAVEISETFDIEPGASVERAAAQVAGLAGAAFAVEIEASVPVVASSLTTWDGTEYGAGAESAVNAAATWYLAEGATKGPFDLFYLLANPNTTPIDVDVTYLRPAPAAPLVQRVTIPARQRLTLWVDTVSPDLAETDVSAILTSVGHERFVVERAMYADDGSGRWGAAGHRAAGVSQPSTTWHFAEGYVGGPFDMYLLIANPQATDATVTVDAFGSTGTIVSQTHVVPARSRVTLYGGDLGVEEGPVSFLVRSTNGQAVVAERAMWWRAAPAAGPWVESHVSAGAVAGARRWGLGDVRSGGARAETQYLLVQNVESHPVSVDVTAYLSDGQRETRIYVVGAAMRLTLDVAAEFPATHGSTANLVIAASGDVVVEASRYWDAAGLHWAAGANLRATPLP